MGSPVRIYKGDGKSSGSLLWDVVTKGGFLPQGEAMYSMIRRKGVLAHNLFGILVLLVLQGQRGLEYSCNFADPIEIFIGVHSSSRTYN